jgi:hypothetical protein
MPFLLARLVGRRGRSYSRATVTASDRFAGFPRSLRASTTRPKALYRRLPGLIAIHGPRAVPRGVEPVERFDDPPILICRSAPRTSLPALGEATVTPVYALSPRGAPAVPTGLVLVCFAEGIAAGTQGKLLSGEGFRLVEPLPYAPNAAWVRSAAGDISASLSGIAALEALPDVVNVEPQMLQRAARR